MRPISIFARIALLFGAVVALAGSAPLNAGPIMGLPVIHDGDTLTITGVKVRLEGIDAPETDQICLDSKGGDFACGLVAREALRKLIGNAMLECDGDKIEQYGRRVSTCSIKGGADVNAAMVKNGWALAYVRYSKRYAALEEAARERGLGLWAGSFIAPWDWRHRDRNTVILGSHAVSISAEAELLPSGDGFSPPAEGCAIKGNINRKGARVYHLPGSRDYDRTRIVENKGERWFCTIAEAEAAGWQASR